MLSNGVSSEFAGTLHSLFTDSAGVGTLNALAAGRAAQAGVACCLVRKKVRQQISAQLLELRSYSQKSTVV